MKLGRKFISAVGGVILVVANRLLGLGLSDKDILYVASLLGGFIAAEGIADIQSRSNGNGKN